MASDDDWYDEDQLRQDYGHIVENSDAEYAYRDPNLLKQLYVDERLSTHEIAVLLDRAQSTIRNWLDRHNIDTRSISEAKWLKGDRHPNDVRRIVNWSGHVKWKLPIDGQDREIPVHRLLAVAEFGFEAVQDKDVHHKNEIPWDNRPENLELMTRSEHTTHHNEKISGSERYWVATLYEKTEMSTYEIAEKYGVSNTTVLYIHREYYGDQSDDPQLATDGGSEMHSHGTERLEKIEAHLYSALNDGDLDDVAHDHVARAYQLLDYDEIEDDESPAAPSDADVHGSFIARDLYPDYDELHGRVKEHASERFAMDGVDTSPETWEINHVGLEDGVVLYKVEHERLGEPEIGEVPR